MLKLEYIGLYRLENGDFGNVLASGYADKAAFY